MLNDTDPELGGAMQLMGIIRLLIDPDNMLGTANVSYLLPVSLVNMQKRIVYSTNNVIASSIDQSVLALWASVMWIY